MATFYLDLENGNDANDGTTFANRWKTFVSGATAARIAPGDTIRVMATPDPTLVGDVAWTNGSKTLTLPAAVTQLITDCDSAWTAAANVTANLPNTLEKSGTSNVQLVPAAGFTTGKMGYFATGTLDLSAYQQVSFWFRSNGAITDGMLTLRLCSDTTGDTAVNTLAIPANPAGGTWTAITVNNGAALGSAIQSVALYAETDPGTSQYNIDNINAAKASSSADALTLNSLIGKVHNLSWAASTTYAANTKRRPTQPNRNGFQYKVTAGGGGASGSSEPTWPEYIGGTVTDGALTWTCEELEDTWYPIQSINGTTVMIDGGPTTTCNISVAATSGRGYYGATETVATYKRECYAAAILSGSSASNAITDSGTANTPIVFSGGWNRTDMSTQAGETWVDGRNGAGRCYQGNANTQHYDLYNLSAARYAIAFLSNTSAGGLIRHFNCSAVACDSSPASYNANPVRHYFKGGALCNSGDATFSAIVPKEDSIWELVRIRMENGYGAPINSNSSVSGEACWVRMEDCHLRNNSGYGVTLFGSMRTLDLFGCKFGGNATGAINDPYHVARCVNCEFPESTEFGGLVIGHEGFIPSGRHDQTANNHKLTYAGGTVVSATDQRHTASGVSWKFQPTNTARGSRYPMAMPIAKIACAAGTTVTVKVWTRRDSTDIKGRLRLRSGQIPGVTEKTVTCEPAINTWEQSSGLTFTPTETGVVEVEFEVYDGVGTANSFWIDDTTVTS